MRALDRHVVLADRHLRLDRVAAHGIEVREVGRNRLGRSDLADLDEDHLAGHIAEVLEETLPRKHLASDGEGGVESLVLGLGIHAIAADSHLVANDGDSGDLRELPSAESVRPVEFENRTERAGPVNDIPHAGSVRERLTADVIAVRRDGVSGATVVRVQAWQPGNVVAGLDVGMHPAGAADAPANDGLAVVGRSQSVDGAVVTLVVEGRQAGL